MSIATATELEVRTVYNLALKTQNILQEYVQGSANGAAGTLSRLTVDEVDELLLDLEAAVADITGSTVTPA